MKNYITASAINLLLLTLCCSISGKSDVPVVIGFCNQQTFRVGEGRDMDMSVDEFLRLVHQMRSEGGNDLDAINRLYLTMCNGEPLDSPNRSILVENRARHYILTHGLLTKKDEDIKAMFRSHDRKPPIKRVSLWMLLFFVPESLLLYWAFNTAKKRLSGSVNHLLGLTLALIVIFGLLHLAAYFEFFQTKENYPGKSFYENALLPLLVAVVIFAGSQILFLLTRQAGVGANPMPPGEIGSISSDFPHNQGQN